MYFRVHRNDLRKGKATSDGTWHVRHAAVPAVMMPVNRVQTELKFIESRNHNYVFTLGTI